MKIEDILGGSVESFDYTVPEVMATVLLMLTRQVRTTKEKLRIVEENNAHLNNLLDVRKKMFEEKEAFFMREGASWRAKAEAANKEVVRLRAKSIKEVKRKGKSGK